MVEKLSEADDVKTALRYAARCVDRMRSAQAVVDEQANDDSLWCAPETLEEDIFQKALRRLHAAVEGTTPEEESE